MICPPVGMNVFVINSIAKDVSLGAIYKGTMPFIAVDLLRLGGGAWPFLVGGVLS